MATRWAWIDMEMTGLDPERDHVLEIASIVTGSDLEILAEGPAIAVYQPEPALDLMDEWNQKTHGASGLVARVRVSKITLPKAEEMTLKFLRQWIKPGQSPICGNSIGQDRRFINRYMPDLDEFLSYRVLDVSTIHELMKRWRPDLKKGFSKESRHEALADIRESIGELRYYRDHFFMRLGPGSD